VSSVRIHESISSVATEWDALADRVGASPFHRPGWIAAWEGAFSEGRPVQVLTVEDGGDLVGAVPILKRRTAISSPTNWHTPAFGPVAASNEAHEALAEALVALRAPRIDISFIDSEDPGLSALRQKARTRRVVERTAMRSPYVPLDGDFETYKASLARKQRKELGRLARRLADEGTVEYAFEDGSQNLDELLDEGFAVEGSGWKAEGGSAIVSSEDTRRFYRDVARWAASRGTLVLAFLRLEGRPLAFDMCIEEAGASNVLKGGFDPEYRRFGPGTLLTATSIERAYEEGLRSYELLGKEDAYKLAWTSSVRERVRFQAFSGSPAGRVSHLAWTRGRDLAKRAQEARHRDTGAAAAASAPAGRSRVEG
jgi:CelD/BcsL family acetyltransferase involved in cellulose biosynthesis